jgi:DNA modification methylase
MEGAAHFWYGERNKDTVIDDEKINYTKAKKADLIQALKDMHEKVYKNSSVIYHDKPSRSSEHPTMKPVKLIGKLMNNSSEKGDTVLDPFGGSGSTLIAAEQLERTCYIVEMDPKYCDVIVKRWEEFTGEKAVKL